MTDPDRWRALSADLEGEFASVESAELGGEIADRTRRETARLRLVDRLRGNIGREIRVECLGHGQLHVRICEVGSNWVLAVAAAGRQVLVSLDAVQSLTGLGAASAEPGSEGRVGARLDLRYALRRLSRDRAEVIVGLVDGGTVSGTIDRVGADFLDVAVHPLGEPRRPGVVQGVCTVPLGSLAVVRSR